MSTATLNTLLELAREARDKAGQLLASERSTSQQIHAQLELLSGYRREYGQQLQQLTEQGVDLMVLHDYQAFLSSLDQAIKQAHESMETQNHRISHCQHSWQQQQKKMTAYDLLAQRRRAQQRQQETRIENRNNDEISALFSSRVRQQKNPESSSE